MFSSVSEEGANQYSGRHNLDKVDQQISKQSSKIKYQIT